MSKITSFVDSVGRVIVGEIVDSKSKQHMEVKEPAVVNVQVNQQSGQISVQLLPFIFREFVKPEVREAGTVWKFNKDNVVTSDNLELEDSIIKQYHSLFSQPVSEPAKKPEPQAPATPDVVKMFDDE
jgi:hypothetical protein